MFGENLFTIPRGESFYVDAHCVKLWNWMKVTLWWVVEMNIIFGKTRENLKEKRMWKRNAMSKSKLTVNVFFSYLHQAPKLPVFSKSIDFINFYVKKKCFVKVIHRQKNCSRSLWFYKGTNSDKYKVTNQTNAFHKHSIWPLDVENSWNWNFIYDT